MKKAATRSKGTTNAGDDLQQMLTSLDARRQLYISTLNLSWRMALTVLVPLFIGVKLDQYFDTAPSLTLAAFMIAVAGASYAVYQTVKEVNQAQVTETKKGRKRRA